MNKLTKYGLTALAGSLVATSVSAGELGVTGSWSWSWDANDSDESGQPMSMGDSVTFAASGIETDQGWTAGVSYELDNGSFDDYKLTLDMGDSGNLTFGESVAGDGISLVSNIVPAADGAVYDMSGDTANDYGVADGASSDSNLGYNITVGDVKVSAEMQKGAGTSRGFGITYTGVENLTLAYGQGDVNPGQVNGGNDEKVMGIKYAVAGATLAYMKTKVDVGGSGGADEDATHMGVSFAVNDDLTVSYGVQEVDIKGKGEDEKNSGFGISYTMGSLSVAASAGKTENGNGVSTADDEGKHLTLSIAF